MSEQGILIAGGYGGVGQRIAADLAPNYPVIVAGRHLQQAKATAAAIGHGVRSREIDVTVEASVAAAVQDIATVVSCIDQPRRGLLHPAIDRGLRYTDITPHLTELGRGAAYEELGAAARASGRPVCAARGRHPRRTIGSRDARGWRAGRCGRRRRERHGALPDEGRGLRARRLDARAGHRSARLLLASLEARAGRRAASVVTEPRSVEAQGERKPRSSDGA
jgi:hypothetical protein